MRRHVHLFATVAVLVLTSCASATRSLERVPLPHPDERLTQKTTEALFGTPAKVSMVGHATQWWYSAVQEVRSGWESGPAVVDWYIEFDSGSSVGIPNRVAGLERFSAELTRHRYGR